MVCVTEIEVRDCTLCLVCTARRGSGLHTWVVCVNAKKSGTLTVCAVHCQSGAMGYTCAWYALVRGRQRLNFAGVPWLFPKDTAGDASVCGLHCQRDIMSCECV